MRIESLPASSVINYELSASRVLWGCGMMIKRPLFFITYLTVSIMMVTSGSAYLKNDINKAKEYIKTGRHTNAIILLEKITNENPNNAEAHFQLGTCYINQDDFTKADKQFESAVRLNPDYGYKIGQRYEKIGTSFLNKDQIPLAIRFFKIVAKYYPDSKKNIAETCYQKGKIYLNSHNINVADNLFYISGNYDPALNEKIENIEVAYGKRLLEIAKEEPVELRQRYIDKASRYLSKKEIEKVFPPFPPKTVFKKEYIGKGFAISDAFETAEYGKDIIYGDKIIITGKNFEVWVGGRTRWKKITSIYEVICKTNVKGKSLGVKAPKGEKIVVTIKRHEAGKL